MVLVGITFGGIVLWGMSLWNCCGGWLVGIAGVFTSYKDKERSVQKVNHTLYVMHERINNLRPHKVNDRRKQDKPAPVPSAVDESGNNDASDIELDMSASRSNLLREKKR